MSSGQLLALHVPSKLDTSKCFSALLDDFHSFPLGFKMFSSLPLQCLLLKFTSLELQFSLQTDKIQFHFFLITTFLSSKW